MKMKTYQLFGYIANTDPAYSHASKKLAEEMARIGKHIPNTMYAAQFRKHLRDFKATQSELEKKL